VAPVALAAGLLAAMTLVLAAPPAWADPAAVARESTVVRALETQLVGLDARAGAAVSAERVAAARLAAVKRQVRQNAAELRTARADLRRSQALLARRLVAIYRQGTPTLADILLDSGGLTATATRITMLERIGRQDSDLVASVRSARDRLQSARARLVVLRAESGRRLAAATSERRTAMALLADRRAVLVQSRATLNILIAQEAARQAAVARQAAAQAQVARLAALRAARTSVDRAVANPTVLPPAPPTATVPSSATLAAIAQCESGGNPAAVSPGGLYRGKYQFDPATWRAAGGTGDPAAAPSAVQDRVAARLYAQRGSAPWPICGRSAP
jgi:peptidoglycan hydrolase CwlO-like protein